MTVHDTHRKDQFTIPTEQSETTLRESDIIHLHSEEYEINHCRYTGKFRGLLAEFYTNEYGGKHLYLSPKKLARFMNNELVTVTETPRVEDEFFGDILHADDDPETASDAVLEHRPAEEEIEKPEETPGLLTGSEESEIDTDIAELEDVPLGAPSQRIE